MSPAASPSKKSKPSSPSLSIQRLKVGTLVLATYAGKTDIGVVDKIYPEHYDIDFLDDNSVAKINARDVEVAPEYKV
jgi:hypothetical protein